MAKKPAHKQGEIRIKERDEDEYFRKGGDPYVLPPELNMTIRDGFRFGIGFILAMMIFFIVLTVGIIVLLRVGKIVNLG